MNLLTNKLPNSVEIDGRKYQINSDFRAMIQFEMLMFDEEIEDEERLTRSLELFYEECPHNLEGAINELLSFYKCGKSEMSEVNSSKRGQNERIYSFEHDDSYIFSAFLNQYSINLQEIEYLHWWQFRALFKSLNETQEFVKIMRYRATDLSKIKDKEQKAYYQKMKDIYKLPINKKEQQQLDKLTEALLSNGDISELL